jgi:UDP-N-acetylglucosamine 2-epimerase (non-hydrolysing)
MKLITFVGTRPEIIRLSRIIPVLDKYCCHLLVHTGQNFADNLNKNFFKELNIRPPDITMRLNNSSLGNQISSILVESERILLDNKPDGILILGDTNSGLVSIIAKRLGIKVFHMEAGNRCFDDIVPEEINRRIIDHCSDILMPYTNGARNNLLKEGIHQRKIYVTGNPITEVLNFYEKQIESSTILNKMNIRKSTYILATSHRAENVDNKLRLGSIIESLYALSKHLNIPVIFSTHPRTRSKLFNMDVPEEIILSEPFGLFDFVHLEKNSRIVITDSGTVQEECCILQIPSITIRDTTERPETIESGSNILSGINTEDIVRGVDTILNSNSSWDIPQEYKVKNVSTIVVNIILDKA